MPTPPKSSTLPPLRLHRDEADGPENIEAVTYKFPSVATLRGAGESVARGSRRRLVAAKVKESPVERCFDGSPCAVFNGGDDPDCLGRIVSSRQLVAEIERTLDRMQDRLSNFRDEVDRAFQFPAPRGDDDLPPAA